MDIKMKLESKGEVNGFERLTRTVKGASYEESYWFIIKKNNKAVQFAYMKYNIGYEVKIMGLDLGYHSDVPVKNNNKVMENCDVIPVCYYNGSGLNADKPLEIYFREGEEAMWQYLEQYYEDMFERDETNEN